MTDNSKQSYDTPSKHKLDLSGALKRLKAINAWLDSPHPKGGVWLDYVDDGFMQAWSDADEYALDESSPVETSAPQLMDRATGVQGVYCIGRIHNGTTEYWDGSRWSAFCGDLYFDLRPVRLITECCKREIDGQDRFCPSCGHECRVLSAVEPRVPCICPKGVSRIDCPVCGDDAHRLPPAPADPTPGENEDKGSAAPSPLKASGRTQEQHRILNANLDQVEWPSEKASDGPFARKCDRCKKLVHSRQPVTTAAFYCSIECAD